MKRMGQGRRVVVTGIGLLCPTGIGTESAWKSILAGRSGIGPVTLFDATTLPCRIAGELPGFDPLDFVGKKDVKKTSRFIQFALAATEFAIRGSRLNMDAETRDRDGFVLGEGAGVLVIEERQHALRRGVEPIAELVGYARNSDAYHANAPLESGEGVRRVMKLALADAAVPPSEIGYLNAHATSTPLGDRAEAAAIRKMFNDHACRGAVTSTKSMTGHLLGGAGRLHAGFPALSLRDPIRPPPINLECPDIDYGLDFVPRTARPLAMRYAMTNSFGFGGGNAALIFKTPD